MNDLISRAGAIAVMKEECWKDREMKLSDRIERRLEAIPTVSQSEAVPPYKTAIGEAGEAYIKSVAYNGKHTLPVSFRWQELWDVLNRAARPAQPETKWTGMGGGIAPKLDPNCECVCHRQPGVMHVAPCCQSRPEAEPVAWTGSGSMMALRDGREGFIWPTKADIHPIPLYAHPTPAPVVPAEGLDAEHLVAAWLAETEGFASRQELLMDDILAECDLAPWLRAACQVGIDAALRAQQPAAPVSGVTVQEAGWQPIETAPRDGTPIIATTNEYDEPLILRWFMVNGHEAWRDWDTDSYINVTHWMPLPEPPALSDLEGK